MKKQQEKRARERSQREAQTRERQKKHLAHAQRQHRQPVHRIQRDPHCLRTAKKRVGQMLARKGLAPKVYPVLMLRMQRLAADEFNVFYGIRDTRRSSTPIARYYQALVRGSCTKGWSLIRFFAFQPPPRRVVRRTRRSTRPHRSFTSPQVSRSARWKVQILSASVMPLKKSGHCWDFSCSRKEKNRFKRIIKNKIEKQAKKWIKHKVASALGITYAQVTVAILLAKMVIKRMVPPDPYFVVHHAGRKIQTSAKDQDTLDPKWKEAPLQINSTPTSKHLKVDVWDGDFNKDDYIGSVRIPLDMRVPAGTKVCIRGQGRLYALCFKMTRIQ